MKNGEEIDNLIEKIENGVDVKELLKKADIEEGDETYEENYWYWLGYVMGVYVTLYWIKEYTVDGPLDDIVGKMKYEP